MSNLQNFGTDVCLRICCSSLTPTFDSIGWLKHDPYMHFGDSLLCHTLPVLSVNTYNLYLTAYIPEVGPCRSSGLPDPMTLRLSIVAWGHQDTSTFPWSPWQKDGSPAAKEGRSKSAEHLPNLCGCVADAVFFATSTNFNWIVVCDLLSTLFISCFKTGLY